MHLRRLIGLLTLVVLLSAPATGVLVTKTTSTPTPGLGATISFLLNVTNNDAFSYTNYTLLDTYNNLFLHYLGASITPTSNTTSGTHTNLSWTFNLSTNASYLIEVNFSTLHAGNTENNATVHNQSGATSATATQPLTIQDATAPTSTINSPPNNTVAPDDTPEIIFTLTDDTNTTINYTIYVDNTPNGQRGKALNNTPTHLNLSALSEGAHTIIVEATDGTGAQTNSTSHTYIFDPHPPGSTINDPPNGTNTSDATPKINFTLTDNQDLGINYRIFVDGSPNGQTGTATNNTKTELTLSPLADGSHNITVEATDNANQSTNSSPLTLTVDANPPVISAVMNSSTNESITVNWTTNEPANSSLSWGADNNTGNTTSSPVLVLQHSLTFGNLTPGTQYYYTITSCDAAGHCTTTALYNATTQPNIPPINISAVKSLAGPPPTLGGTVTFLLNITNNDAMNYTNFTIVDDYNASELNYTGSNETPTTTTADEVEWRVNLSAHEERLILINFTTLADGNSQNNVLVENTARMVLVNNSVLFTVQSPQPPAQLSKTASASSVPLNDTVQFILNVTNFQGPVVNWTLIDNYTPEDLNYTWANRTPDFLNTTTGEIEWRFNLSENETEIILINFTTLRDVETTNVILLENDTETLGTANETIRITQSTGNYTPLWSQAQPATFYPWDITDFNFLGAPYVARGDGCGFTNFDYYDSSVPGQNCCSRKSFTDPDGCNGNGRVSYDLGAVWVDRTGEFIAWRIAGPYAGNGNLSVCDGLNRSTAFVVEFDVDDNQSTGCDNNAGEGCYPGADYQIWFFPDSNETLFAYHNGTNDYGIAFEANTTLSATAMWVWYNCSANDSAERGITIIVNMTAAFGNTTPKLNFETNTFNTTEATTNPIDQLTDYSNGGPVDPWLFTGPGVDEGACYQWDHTNQSACENNTDGLPCQWKDLSPTDGLCDPDFDRFAAGTSCFTLDDPVTCADNEHNGVGFCHWDADVTQPNGTVGLCVEDFDPYAFGGGDCDADCFNCFTEAQCNGSDANGGHEWGGCAWYTDVFNPAGWCDVKGIKTGCAATPDDCLTQNDCTTAGWSWNAAWNVCLAHAGDEVCFNGIDDNGDGDTDCDDSTCEDAKYCGAHVNTLTGTYAGFEPDEALLMKLSNGMGPVLNLAEDTPGDQADPGKNIKALGIGVADLGIGVGMVIENLSNLTACDGLISDRKFLYLIDNDADNTTGCNLTIDGTQHDGYEYVVRYGNYSVVNDSGQQRMLSACYHGTWILRDAVIIPPPRRPDAPDSPGGPGGPGTNEPMECEYDPVPDGYAAVVLIEKADIGNPTNDIRFAGVVLNGSWDNFSNLSAADTIFDAYYTPGTMNFAPVDCFQEPTKCGTAFMVLGGGEFMPVEDCLMPGDEDADGLENCADSDCAFAPQCSGSYNPATDKTRPRVTLHTVETFEDAAFIRWVTDEPTNGSIAWYENSSDCSSLNSTLTDEGDPTITADDYRPWHALPLDAFTLTHALEPNTTYYYKILTTDPAGNAAISSCLNFTTSAAPSNVSLVFNFTGNGTPEDFLGNMSIILNGTELGPGSSSQFEGGLSGVNMTIKNPSANDTTNWSITLVDIDFTTADFLDFSEEVLGDDTGEKGDFIGLDHDEWLNLVQKLGADYLIIRIPDTGSHLYHCLNNGTNCSDVSTTAGVSLLTTGQDYTEWRVPTTLGFSSYSTGTPPNITYTLNYTNLTDATVSANAGENATIELLVNNTMNTTETYNFTLDLPGDLTGWVNASPRLVNVIIPSNDTTHLNITIQGASTGTTNFSVLGILANDSSVILNSSDDLTLSLTVADLTPPTITGPTNHSITTTTAVINWTTDEAANGTVNYGTTTSLGTKTSNTSRSTNHSFTLTGLSPGTTYHYNVTSCDANGNCATEGLNNFTTAADTTPPAVGLVSPADAYATTATLTLNCSATDAIGLENITFLVWNHTGALDATHTTTVTGTSASAQWSFTPSADGNFTWTCQATDTSDNTGTTTNRTFTYDTTAPTTTDDAPAGWQGSAFTVTLTPSDDGVGTNYTTYTLDGTAANGTSIAISTEGNHTITYYSVDSLGNTETTHTTTAALDLNNPTVTLTAPPNATTALTFTLNCTASDTINLTSLTLLVWNSTGALDYTATTTQTAPTLNGSWNFTPASDGRYTWNCRATDVAGHTANATTNRTVIRDTTNPNSTITAPANNSFTSDNTPTITFLLRDLLDHTLAYTVFVDGSSDQTGTATNNTATNATLSALSEGDHAIRVEARDDAGNSANSTLLNLTVDTTSPGLNITHPPDNATIHKNWTLINWTANDTNLATSTLSVDYGWFTATRTGTTNSVNVTNLTGGKHVYTVTVNDSAGNTNSDTRSFTVDLPVNLTNFTSELERNTGLTDVDIVDAENPAENLTGNESVNTSNQTLTLLFHPLVVKGHTPKARIEHFSAAQTNYQARFTALSEDNDTNRTIIRLGSTPVQLLSLIDVDKVIAGEYNGTVTFNTSDTNYTYVYWCAGENGTGCVKVPQCAGNDPANFTGNSSCYTNTTTNTTVYVPHFSSVILSLDNIVGTLNITSPDNSSPLTNGSATRLSFTASETITGNFTLALAGEVALMMNTTSLGAPATSFTIPLTSNQTQNVLQNGTYTVHFRLRDEQNNTDEVNYTFIIADNTAPGLGTPSATNITTSSAIITVSADEFTSITVNYGTTSGSLGTSSSASSYSFTPSVTLTGLSAGTTYYYEVVGRDVDGRSRTTAEASFTTSSASTSSSSGGGGGGGTTTTARTLGTRPVRLTLNLNGQYNFYLPDNELDYSVRVTELPGDDTVTLYFPDIAKEYTLAEGESTTVDLTGDGQDDITVTIITASLNSVYFTLQTVTPPSNTPTTTPSTPPSETQNQTTTETPAPETAPEAAPEAAPANESEPEPAASEERHHGGIVIILVAVIMLLIVLGWIAVKKQRIQFD